MKPFDSLTESEAHVLALLCCGFLTYEIAEKRFVNIQTVRSQTKGVLRKLKVRSQGQAIALAYQTGWFITDEEEWA